jgi:hypothetical protein
MTQTTIDTSVLQRRVKEWAAAVGVSMQEAVHKQAGLLKWELMAGAPPKSLKASKAKALKDARGQFRPGENSQTKQPWNVFAGKKVGKGTTRWLYAGPSFVAGVDQADFQPQMSASEMHKLMAANRGFLRGAAWHDQGEKIKGTKKYKASRGKQHVMILRRTVVKPSQFKKLQGVLMESFGKLKAAWAVDLDQFPMAESKKIPPWVSKHLRSGVKGTNVIMLNGDKPHIDIINQSPGVSHQRAVDNVRRAVKKRAGAIAADIKLYLNGTKKKAGLTGLWLLITPLGITLDAQSVGSAPALVSGDFGIAQHQALAVRAVDGKEHFAQVVKVADDTIFDRTRYAAALQAHGGSINPAAPSANHVGSVEHHVADVGCPMSVLGSHPSLLEALAARPQFSIKPESLRQLPGEFVGRGDAVAVSGPQAEPIPERPAAVKLLAELPSGQVGFTRPRPEQRHVTLIHAATLANAQLSGNGKTDLIL